MVTVAGEPSGILSLRELERLQQSTLANQAIEAESLQEVWRRKWNYYHSLNRDVFDSIINDALTRASQGAQWDSLRTNILSRLESIYVLRDEARVRSFLGKNAFLAPLLLQTNSKIREYFGASLPIALEISVDPENSNYQELWARIQTHLAPAEALPVLTRFDEEWWIQASVASMNLLNIKLEYV